MMWRNRLLGSASALAMLIGAPAAFAADVTRPLFLPGSLPAVSAINGKAAIFGGTIDGLHAFGLAGSLSLPINRQLGLQGDILIGSAGGANFQGAAGHLFWRDPTQALLGVYASWVDWSPIGAEVTKFGIEGEWYSGPISFEGLLAMQGGTYTGMAANATVAFYLHQNLRLDASIRHLEGVGTFAGLGAEWQHDSTGLALFANANWGDSNYESFIAGVKFYAGPSKSLIRRHREDDPASILPWDLHQLAPVNISCGGDQALVMCD
jgi:hypothetical protein